MYNPHKNISINESLMQCRSRLYYIQFIRAKRVRFGIKFYKSCNCETKKYIYKISKHTLEKTKLILNLLI